MPGTRELQGKKDGREDAAMAAAMDEIVFCLITLQGDLYTPAAAAVKRILSHSGFLVRSIHTRVKQLAAARMCLSEWPLN